MTPKQNDMLQHEYARAALQQGLKHAQKLGVNPFKFGMVGGTDNHVSLSTTREENFFGKLPALLPGPERTKEAMVMKADKTPAVESWETSASGLTGVWAKENSRESLFDAMARKEVYATTGTRITVRVFAGWDFATDEVERPDIARQGYARGVPMGGDLRQAPSGKAPTFMVRALRDPDGANLDRIQIVKGWVDGQGEPQERIYDVAVSDGRTIGADGRRKTPVGSTVDVAEAHYRNSIGDALLMGHWEDPDFDARQSAVYYVRVIEIPTPRWTAYDAKRFGIQLPEEIRMTVQDRAYTSPIWYTPYWFELVHPSVTARAVAEGKTLPIVAFAWLAVRAVELLKVEMAARMPLPELVFEVPPAGCGANGLEIQGEPSLRSILGQQTSPPREEAQVAGAYVWRWGAPRWCLACYFSVC